jgi:A/G-specific adenine glycosylase
MSGASRYCQIVSEVLLQRTRAETVAAFWPSFYRRFPNWQSLSSASVEEIERVLKPIGMAKQRAPRLFALATAVIRSKGRFSSDRKILEELPGVGQYIANAILLFCHGEEEPLLDVNMARLIERFFGPRKLADIRYDPYLQSLAKAITAGVEARHVNWAILDFASMVCKSRKPLCATCTLRNGCRFWRSNVQKRE